MSMHCFRLEVFSANFGLLNTVIYGHLIVGNVPVSCRPGVDPLQLVTRLLIVKIDSHCSVCYATFFSVPKPFSEITTIDQRQSITITHVRFK